MILKRCTPIVPRAITENQSCLEVLPEYFLEEPVWSYSALHYYDNDLGTFPLPVNMVNSRPKILPYIFLDFVDGEIPIWRDIFDDAIEEREDLFPDVVRTPKCKQLISNQSEGIQEHLAADCAARELYKYATYRLRRNER